MILFGRGTPDEPGEALAATRTALLAPDPIRWRVDPGNLGLLSRTVRDLEGSRPVEVVLPAQDFAFDRTVVANENELVPTLRRIFENVSLMMTNGRPYVLPPPALDISTNDLCGLACNMCGNRATRRDPGTMRPEEVQALIAEAADWGIRRVALTGAGEPFRDPRMLDHLRFANGLGHLVTITTNGFPVSEAIAKELAASVVSISVSIHGATEAMHDAIVGIPKAGDNAWRAIRRMVKAKRETRGSKLSVSISTVIQRQNLDEIPALVRRAREEGCDGINIQPVNLQHGSFRGGAIVRRDDVIRMTELWPRSGIEEVFDELLALKKELGRFVHASADRLLLFRRYFRDASREALGVACRVGEAFLAVDHRGQIKPCYRLPWSHGDARLASIRGLWNSQAYARTRALVDACPLTCLNNCFFREKRA